MTHDFLIGARPMHDGDMLRLGLRQLAASEALLKKLLVAYEQTRTEHLAQEVARECTFISQTLDALDEMVYSRSGRQTFVISGALLKAREYLGNLVVQAEKAVS